MAPSRVLAAATAAAAPLTKIGATSPTVNNCATAARFHTATPTQTEIGAVSTAGTSPPVTRAARSRNVPASPKRRAPMGENVRT